MSRLLVGLFLATALFLTGCASSSRSELESNAENGSYVVAGAVIHPSTYHLPENHVLTLGQAIRRAGGPWPGDSYNDGGDLSRVQLQRVVHGSVVSYTLDSTPAGHDEAFIIKAGDSIRVLKMPFGTNIPIPAPFAD